MSGLIIMQGIPGSGKSTRARAIAESVANPMRVNRDLLRKMLHFGEWSKENERLIFVMECSLIRQGLINGRTVIIDDTNLQMKTVKAWEELASIYNDQVYFCLIDTHVEECIRRDALRAGPERVGEAVIRKFEKELPPWRQYVKGREWSQWSERIEPDIHASTPRQEATEVKI